MRISKGSRVEETEGRISSKVRLEIYAAVSGFGCMAVSYLDGRFQNFRITRPCPKHAG